MLRFQAFHPMPLTASEPLAVEGHLQLDITAAPGGPIASSLWGRYRLSSEQISPDVHRVIASWCDDGSSLEFLPLSELDRRLAEDSRLEDGTRVIEGGDMRASMLAAEFLSDIGLRASSCPLRDLSLARDLEPFTLPTTPDDPVVHVGALGFDAVIGGSVTHPLARTVGDLLALVEVAKLRASYGSELAATKAAFKRTHGEATWALVVGHLMPSLAAMRDAGLLRVREDPAAERDRLAELAECETQLVDRIGEVDAKLRAAGVERAAARDAEALIAASRQRRRAERIRASH